LILAWITTHSKILERFESQAYFGYDHFVRSNAYSTVLVTLLGLNVNNPDENSQSILSLTGIQMVDQQLNTIKTKTFEVLTYLLTYVFDGMDR
jgi:hypothetical protein